MSQSTSESWKRRPSLTLSSLGGNNASKKPRKFGAEAFGSPLMEIKVSFVALEHNLTILLVQTGLGNHYGTFGGPINHFSNQTKPQEIKKEKPNVITNPSKKVLFLC